MTTLRVIELLAPAAGAQSQYTVVGVRRWRVQSVVWTMAAGASAAANPVVDILAQGAVILMTASGSNQMAVLETVTVQAAINYPPGKNTAGPSIQMALPDVWVTRDATVRVRFDGGGVGTQISNVVLVLELSDT